MQFPEWSRDRQVRWLLRLSHRLTISAREEYLVAATEPSKAIEGLRCYNVIAHQVSSHAALLLEGETQKIYPMDVFFAVIVETAENAGRLLQLRQAMEYVSSSEDTSHGEG